MIRPPPSDTFLRCLFRQSHPTFRCLLPSINPQPSYLNPSFHRRPLGLECQSFSYCVRLWHGFGRHKWYQHHAPIWPFRKLESSPTRLEDDGHGDMDESKHLLRSPSPSDLDTVSDATPKNRSSSRAFERWLFTDWLRDNKSARKAGRQKEPALPILKDAKWNSGDNPVLVATLLIGIGVLVSAVTERVATTTI